MKIVNWDNEVDLLKSIANGSEAAFSQLFDRYKNNVYGHALHFTQSVFIAEEITQDVFLKCWLKKESLADIQSLEAWLFTLTKNCCFNHLKKIAREHKLKSSLSQLGEDANENVESYLAVKEQQNLLQQAIDHLSAQQKLVFRLNRDAGLKNAEIAEQLNISPNTVKTHMVSAIRSIRLFFKTHAESAIQVLLLLHIIK
jgi:RNA polymerase sigma-70 factor (ECF subfamily)